MIVDPIGHLTSLLLHGLIFLGMAFAYAQVRAAVEAERWRPVAEGLTFAGMSVAMAVLFDTPYPDGGPGDGSVLPLVIAACFIGAPGTIVALTFSLVTRAFIDSIEMVHVATDLAMVAVTYVAAKYLRGTAWTLPRLTIAGLSGWVLGGSVTLLFLPERLGQFGEHGVISLIYLGGVIVAGWLIETTMRRERRRSELLRQGAVFVEAVNHELRTPMTELLGYVDLLEESGPDLGAERRREYLEGIVRAGMETSNIVGDLVSVSRLSIDELKVTPERVSVDLVLRSVAQAHPDWSVEFEPSGQVVFGDPQRLGQVLRNLVANAHAHGGGAARIDVRSESGSTVIDVSDHGPGVPEGLEDQIFDLHVTTGGRSGQGAGIGLWLCRSLINRMDGVIRYERRDGRTHFIVELPSAG